MGHMNTLQGTSIMDLTTFAVEAADDGAGEDTTGDTHSHVGRVTLMGRHTVTVWPEDAVVTRHANRAAALAAFRAAEVEWAKDPASEHPSPLAWVLS